MLVQSLLGRVVCAVPVRDRSLNECNGLPAPELPLRGAVWAVFLDIDGTLLELAQAPDAVQVPPTLVSRLQRLRGQLDGALALATGRPVHEVDRLFAPAKFPVAGVHGAELRLPGRAIRRIPVDPTRLDPVRQAFGRFAAEHPGTQVEDKGLSVALHYRLQPAVVAETRQLGTALVARLGPEFQLLEGKMVVEIRASAATKGAAVEAFLQEAPFAGRRPVYVGDDVTDEDAFRAVDRAGGAPIVVGDVSHTAARYRLTDVAAVHDWLRRIMEHLDRIG